MRVLFVTSECTPWCKTGGLADVSASLPAALRALGIDVRVMLPAYAEVLAQARVARVASFAPLAGLPAAQVLQAQLPSGVPALLVDSPALYARAGGPYQDASGADWADNGIRFAQLARVAAAFAQPDGARWRAQLIHCNDWQAALAPAYLRSQANARAASIVTIHNLAFQGLFAPEIVAQAGLPKESFAIDGLEFHGRCSFLKGGLVYADAITTVSPGYAREIQTEAGGMGLHGLLSHRRAALHGILNGIDEESWDPRRDRLIAARYGPDDLEKKALNKRALSERLGLRTSAAPLAGMICRLTGQKGVDLVLASAEPLLEGGAQLAVLGLGDAAFERSFAELAAAHPGQVAVTLDFDEALAHQIEAGADVFLMPSRYEPCGMNQMYSQRYGTVPVVRATGGLADTVIDEAREGGSGFVFDAAEPQAFAQALGRMRVAYGNAARWRELQRNGMARDFSWTASARAYRDVYERILKEPLRATS